jgi:hypothetical protein
MTQISHPSVAEPYTVSRMLAEDDGPADALLAEVIDGLAVIAVLMETPAAARTVERLRLKAMTVQEMIREQAEPTH